MASLYDRQRLIEELERAGMRDVVVHCAQHDITLPADILASDSPMIGSNPLIVGLDNSQRDAVIERAARVSEQWRQRDVIRMPSIAHLAAATKVAGL